MPLFVEAALPFCRSAVISRPVSVRLLLSALIAMAMAFAPLAMPIGEALAAQPSHHGAAAGMAKDDHCSGKPQQKHAQKDKKSCCVAGCFALASLNAPEAGMAVPRSSVEQPVREQFRHGFLGEIATPPPRIS